MRIDYLDARCVERLREAMRDPFFDNGKFLRWLDDNAVKDKRNPSAYFMRAFPNSLARGDFTTADVPEPSTPDPKPPEARRRTVDEYLHDFEHWDDFPEPIDVADEAAQEEAQKTMHEGFLKSVGVDWGWTEPVPEEDREDVISRIWPERLRRDYRRHPEYLENTWISLYRESRERNTSVRQLCRERGMKYEGLLW